MKRHGGKLENETHPKIIKFLSYFTLWFWNHEKNEKIEEGFCNYLLNEGAPVRGRSPMTKTR